MKLIPIILLFCLNVSGQDFKEYWRVYWVLETSDYVIKNIEIPNNHNRQINNYNSPVKLTRVAILDTLNKDFNDYNEAEKFKKETQKIIKHDPNGKYFNDRIIDVWIKRIYKSNDNK
jgi:hypothetical protein